MLFYGCTNTTTTTTTTTTNNNNNNYYYYYYYYYLLQLSCHSVAVVLTLDTDKTNKNKLT